ncbi:unnamed protein product, partial [Closterium sp. NIES-54]
SLRYPSLAPHSMHPSPCTPLRAVHPSPCTPLRAVHPSPCTPLRAPPVPHQDFLQSQSALAKLTVDVRPSHAAIASDLLAPLPTTPTPATAPSPSSAPSPAPSTGQKKAWGKKGSAQPSLRSAAAADVVTVGDRWLKELIARGALLPLDGVERSDWFKALGPTWL